MVQDAVVMFEGTIYENGYGWVAQKVMRDKTITPQAKAIYGYICSLAGNPTDIDNRKAFPSVSLMKEEIGISNQKSFYKHMNQLKEKGYLQVVQEKNEQGKFKRNIYKIVAVPEPIKKQEKPYPKNSGTVVNPERENHVMDENIDMTEIEPKLQNVTTEKNRSYKNGSTVLGTAEFVTTNSNRFTRNSFNKKEDTILDTYKETAKADFSSTQIEREKDQKYKESLKKDIPPVTFQSLFVLSENYEEMYKWVGIVLRAKKKVEEERNELLLLEQIDHELNQVLIAGIRKIKKDVTIKNQDNYLFMAIYNELEKMVAEFHRRNAIGQAPYHNWLEV